MSQRDDAKRPGALAIAGAIGVAILLLAGIAWHVSDLRSAALELARRRFTSGATIAARMVDAWFVERDADASAIAEVAGIHGSDSTNLSPSIAGRIMRIEMETLRRRAQYVGIWVTNDHGFVLGSTGGQTLTPAEVNAAARSMSARGLVVGPPERHDSSVTVGVAKPILATSGDTVRPQAAVVFRSDLNRAFSQNVSGAPRAAGAVSPVIVVPVDDSFVGITMCPPPASTVCLTSANDTLSRIARGLPDGFQRIVIGGKPMLVATHRVTNLPWSVYYATDEATQFAPMYDRLRFEAVLLTGILFMFGLGAYAYDRSVRLKHATERAQTEARFASIVNTAMDGIIIVDREYKIAVMNSAAELMFGYPPRDVIGRSVLELVPASAADTFRRALDRALRGGGHAPRISTERYAAGLRRNGSTFPIELSISPAQVDGEPHLTIVLRDVTDWQRAEEGSEWHRKVLEAIATGVELREVLANIARFHETQCPGVEVSVHLLDDDGVTLRSASAPSMRTEFLDAMDEIVVGPMSTTGGTAVFRREQVVSLDIAADPLWNDHRSLALEQGYRTCWANPIRSPQGAILGALAVYSRELRGPATAEFQVTATATQLLGIAVDRAHAAESLLQSEASFRSFVENSPIGIYRATGTGRLLAVNQSLVELLGYDSVLELLQVDMTRALFVSSVDRDRLLRPLETEGELRSAEMDWRRKNGSVVSVRVSARAYSDERGTVWFSEGFVENVTPLRAAEQALRQSEKLAALGQLVSGVAHELNNPLAAILHFAEDLLNDERTPADLEAISVIRDQARRSRTIVRDLLSFVRFRDTNRERVQLGEALAASVKALGPAVEDHGARLVSELPPAGAVGLTDRAGLQQIVTNLVINAAQASGRGGVVRLRAEMTGADLIIVVEDTGPGIPPEIMDRMFEPFFTTKPLGEGTGLGLSVTLGIVQQLGGRIRVENRDAGDGTGARFVVHIPVGGTLAALAADTTPPATGGLLPPAPGAAATLGPRVLVIDDEPSIRAALRRFFSRRGWRVTEAADGAEGLTALLASKLEFAVVISDLKMPGCSGVELHDHIAAIAPELLERIVFSTGDVASKDAAAFVRRTKCTVLQKPFELRALEKIVSRMRQLTPA